MVECWSSLPLHQRRPNTRAHWMLWRLASRTRYLHQRKPREGSLHRLGWRRRPTSNHGHGQRIRRSSCLGLVLLRCRSCPQRRPSMYRNWFWHRFIIGIIKFRKVCWIHGISEPHCQSFWENFVWNKQKLLLTCFFDFLKICLSNVCPSQTVGKKGSESGKIVKSRRKVSGFFWWVGDMVITSNQFSSYRQNVFRPT